MTREVEGGKVDGGAIKYDNGKPDLSIVPVALIEAAARALMFGTKKYKKHNYRNGFDYSRLASALLRHVYAWNEGEEFDQESGLSHLDHAGACLAMLLANLKEGRGNDDRYNPAETY